ncbi:conserved hypothetical protein [Leishmania mexicana MHOM/GT/2001/U1103]|uniref:Uncharacterized protein n=1 Tax=Leishmania mexicana (strain MHOM/GT/2001/U1103) TaxID=929439 RepID=E9AXA7_LEIMU|nr:conserved hypothetical protein [Leishmania mexicana MHOM/GT/2001/U1103]CBZ27598.1 conserved hypothetical protein [Leishmania mexicana MHOM/GT/2001/U1103]
MSAAEATHTEKAAAVDEDAKATSAMTSSKEASGKTLLPLSLTPAERHGLLMVVAVALLQEVHSNVVCGALVGAASAAIVYNQLIRLRRSP